jgi:hypothetical protein
MRGIEMTRHLIIIRTHRADDASLAAYDLFAKIADCETVFCVDERSGPVDMGGRAKVAFDDVTLAAMGLYAHPMSGYRCGDYCYYIARQAQPGHDFYWLIEPDVRINAADPGRFLAQFDACPADLLAAQYGPRTAIWGWSRTILPLGVAPQGCLYPITRLSGRAIDHLLAMRRRHSADPAVAERNAWPNDEAFTASFLTDGDFHCADLNHDGITCYTAQTLAVTAVVDYARVQAAPPDGLIYHPVRDFDLWLAQADKRIAEKIGSVDLAQGKATRADASFFTGTARACLRHPDHAGIALAPLMVAQALWTARPWAQTPQPQIPTADAHQAEQCRRLLQRHFGTSPARPALGTVHLAACLWKRRRADRLTTAITDDFAFGPGFTLGQFPARHALPFVFDADWTALLLTLHLRPHDLLHAPFLYAAQRERARVMARLPLSALPTIFGPPDREASPVLIFSLGRTGSTLLEKLVGCVTQRSISEPDTATQLSENRHRLAALPPPQRTALVHYAIAPFFDLHIPGAEHARCVIKFRSQVNGIAAAVATTFPKARYVFMLRERRAWARSTFRAFRMPADKVADRLHHGLQGLAALQAAGVDLHVLDYDEMVANPVAAVGRVMDIDVSTQPALAARIHAVMAEDSQASHRLSRETTSRPRDDEEGWLEAFEQAWAARAVGVRCPTEAGGFAPSTPTRGWPPGPP